MQVDRGMRVTGHEPSFRRQDSVSALLAARDNPDGSREILVRFSRPGAHLPPVWVPVSEVRAHVPSMLLRFYEKHTVLQFP